MRATSASDPRRLKRLQRLLREGMKPSRFYDDNPADTGSLYRKRWESNLDICADIMRESPDPDLVKFAKQMIIDAMGQLPLTFAEWSKKTTSK
jgi:hypothetical protein